MSAYEPTQPVTVIPTNPERLRAFLRDAAVSIGEAAVLAAVLSGAAVAAWLVALLVAMLMG